MSFFFSAGLRNTIPDSALYHYPMPERSGSAITEQLEGEDATANGTTNVSGSWYQAFAEEGSGSGSYIATPDSLWDDYVTQTGGEYWIAATFQTDATGFQYLVSLDSIDADPNEYWRHGLSGDSELAWRLADNSGNEDEVTTDATWDDGNPHRAVFNRTGPTGNDMEIWVDGTEESITVGSAEGFDATFDSTVGEGPYLLGNNRDGSISNPLDGTMDNVILGDIGTSLSPTEIQADYDNQPWS